MNNKANETMSKTDNTGIDLEMLDTKSNACKVLKCLRFGDSLTIAKISAATGLLKSSTNSAIIFLEKSKRLCEI